MQAIGLVETRGLLAATEALDQMLKAANTQFLGRYVVGAGLICIVVTGDIASVQASVHSAETAVNVLGAELFLTCHVIPSPDECLERILFPNIKIPEKSEEEESLLKEKLQIKAVSEKNLNTKAFPGVIAEFQNESMNPVDIKKYINLYGIESMLFQLGQMKTVELRLLARKVNNFPIRGRDISSAKKAELINFFKKCYEQAEKE